MIENSDSEVWLGRIEELYQKLSKSNDPKVMLKLLSILVDIYKFERERENDKQLSLDEYVNSITKS